jgi:hypothetical protein
VVQGGSAASENLTLSATAHGTPGNIYLCATAATAAATVNQYGLGVSAGVADATHAVYISKAATNVALRIDNTNAAGATTSASIFLSHGTSALQLGKVSASYTPAYGILAGDSYFSYVAASFISNSYHRWVCYDTDYRERMRLTGVAASSTLQIVHGVAGATSYASLQLTNSANSGNVLITSTTWTPAYGENANELVVSAGSNVSSLNLHTVSAAPIYFTTTQNLRMTILAGSNTLQGNAGLTLQGGAATGNAITISSNASNDGAINIGVAATDKVGFYGVTAVVRPAAFTQTYSTASRTHAALTTSDLDATATTQTTPWGFATQAQGDAIATKVNQLIDDVENAKQVLNQVLDDLQLNGLLQ